jgi:hypothetical protein
MVLEPLLQKKDIDATPPPGTEFDAVFNENLSL